MPDLHAAVVATPASGAQDEDPTGRRILRATPIADAAPEYVSDWEIRALVTSAVQRGLCTPEELSDALVRAARRGSARLRRALEDVRDGAGSVSEALAADRLRAADVPPFALNVPILDAQGRLIAVADFLWRELRAVLEIDSREFHFTETDWKRTTDRHNLLTSLGFAVTHYPPSRVARDPGWADEVALAARTRPGHGRRVPSRSAGRA